MRRTCGSQRHQLTTESRHIWAVSFARLRSYSDWTATAYVDLPDPYPCWIGSGIPFEKQDPLGSASSRFSQFPRTIVRPSHPPATSGAHHRDRIRIGYVRIGSSIVKDDRFWWRHNATGMSLKNHASFLQRPLRFPTSSRPFNFLNHRLYLIRWSMGMQLWDIAPARVRAPEYSYRNAQKCLYWRCGHWNILSWGSLSAVRSFI